MSINQRIRMLMEHYHLTQVKFAQITGIKYQSVSTIYNEKNTPSAELISKILENFKDINARWLLTGEGDMFYSAKPQSLDNSNNELTKKYQDLLVENSRLKDKLLSIYESR